MAKVNGMSARIATEKTNASLEAFRAEAAKWERIAKANEASYLREQEQRQEAAENIIRLNTMLGMGETADRKIRDLEERLASMRMERATAVRDRDEARNEAKQARAEVKKLSDEVAVLKYQLDQEDPEPEGDEEEAPPLGEALCSFVDAVRAAWRARR